MSDDQTPDVAPPEPAPQGARLRAHVAVMFEHFDFLAAAIEPALDNLSEPAAKALTGRSVHAAVSFGLELKRLQRALGGTAMPC